jgi:hypothetical protein
MSSLVAEAAEDGDRRESDACYLPMYERLAFNAHLVKIGFSKMYIKDMTQPQFQEYERLLGMLKAISDEISED